MQMVQSDADHIYAAVTKFADKKPILLIFHSSGGYVGPAYLIGKLLREYSEGKLEIAVPRLAKSGATLLCCAADHLHMGSLSELGPIDPQFEGLPALGLKSAIQHIAELVAEYPHATDLLSKYMSQTIRPQHILKASRRFWETQIRPNKKIEATRNNLCGLFSKAGCPCASLWSLYANFFSKSSLLHSS
jgi:ClpP class serine protease